MGIVKLENDFTNAKYKLGEWVTFKHDGCTIRGLIKYYHKGHYFVNVFLRNGGQTFYEIEEKDIMSEPEAKYGKTTAIGDLRHMKFKEITEYMFKTYKEKNAIYGDSYIQGVKRYGKTSALQILFQKFSRIENIIMKDINAEEGLGDSILDMANYLIMTYMALELEKPLKLENE